MTMEKLDRIGHDDGPLIENRIPDRLLTVKQVAERLGVERKKVYRLLEKKQIPGIAVGGAWRFDWADVIGALKTRPMHGNEER